MASNDLDNDRIKDFWEEIPPLNSNDPISFDNMSTYDAFMCPIQDLSGTVAPLEYVVNKDSVHNLQFSGQRWDTPVTE